jgi:hypothetical protein
MVEAAAAAVKKPLPVVPFLKIPESGDPYLEGVRCSKCSSVFLGARDVCASCGKDNARLGVVVTFPGYPEENWPGTRATLSPPCPPRTSPCG